MCERIKNTEVIFKNTTDPIPYLHLCKKELERRERGPKIGFNKELEIVYLCFISLKQI